METMSVSEARAIVLASQGLGARSGTVSGPSRTVMLGMVDRLGVLQIDAVNVLERAHYLPLFTRLGPYDRTRVDDAAYGRSRSLFEYWGHQASLLPTSMFPLFRWRMEHARKLEGIYGGLVRFVKRRRAYVDEILREVTDRGPLRAAELEMGAPRKGGWWGWSDAKRALEWLFWSGQVTTSTRKSFERLYDLTERVFPKESSIPAPSETDAHRELLRISARSLGIATEDDLADYFRLRLRDVRPRIAELVEERALVRTKVEGIAKPMFLFRGAEKAAQKLDVTSVRAILSPFDPLVWYRARSERLFDFHYRIEIYTPAHLRKHGYYVLPFLLGDRIAARVDLKADRAASTLLVQASHLEPGSSASDAAPALAFELREVARWLSLERIVVAKRGGLAKALAASTRATR